MPAPPAGRAGPRRRRSGRSGDGRGFSLGFRSSPYAERWAASAGDGVHVSGGSGPALPGRQSPAGTQAALCPEADSQPLWTQIWSGQPLSLTLTRPSATSTVRDDAVSAGKRNGGRPVQAQHGLPRPASSPRRCPPDGEQASAGEQQGGGEHARRQDEISPADSRGAAGPGRWFSKNTPPALNPYPEYDILFPVKLQDICGDSSSARAAARRTPLGKKDSDGFCLSHAGAGDKRPPLPVRGWGAAETMGTALPGRHRRPQCQGLGRAGRCPCHAGKGWDRGDGIPGIGPNPLLTQVPGRGGRLPGGFSPRYRRGIGHGRLPKRPPGWRPTRYRMKPGCSKESSAIPFFPWRWSAPPPGRAARSPRWRC